VSRLGPPVLGRGPAIRSGPVPALADGFTNRPESAPGLAGLDPGTAVALVCAAASRPEQPAGPCGKTQLAVQAAESLWRSGRVELLAWIDASSRASVLSGHGEAAAAAGIRSAGPAEEVAARLTSWLADTARPWLVVLDDVHDAADLAGLWPCGPAGRVVITSPDEQAVSGEKSEFQPQVCPVGPFSTREALNYLMGRLADDPDQRHGAIDLAATLDGDPVALTHASAVIATTTQSCADYQRHYAHKRTRMAARQAHGEPLVAPAVTWILSAERASQLSPGGATQLLLVLAALLDGQAVPAAMFTTPATCKYLAESGASAADADRAWEAVRALAHTGLFTIDLAPAPPVVRLSRLVAALVRAATPEQVLERAAVGAADALLEIWPQREPRPWLAAGLRSCVDALQRISADRLWAADACHPLLLKAGHSLDSGGLNGPSVRHWAQLATTGNRILSSGHPDTLAVGSHLAHALQAAGQATEATAWWQWVAAGRARAFGPDHPSTLAARVSLGNAMAAAGQPGSAVGVLEQAVADSERVRGAGHPDTFRARDGLAAAYLADGRLKDAITCYKKTLADRQHALGADHPDTITACRNLAAAYQAAGKIAAALQLCEQVRVGQEQILGADHPDTLACRADLAHAYIGAGRLADAATLLRDTLTRCEQALPPGDPLTGAVRQALTGLAGQ
jgi:tetratricopeptide (TPR) repeat protein